MLVYVLNKDGKPLMPCKSVKARILLKCKEAKVIRREPFTIQLLYGSSGYKQPVTLGVDAGAKHIGLSASTKRKEL
ncbi:MAG: RRXRR domain-containing protein, partial [Synergistaceae bacterium]|nr:RRXRR domain-containing protein [Synergistaceae bacterium]